MIKIAHEYVTIFKNDNKIKLSFQHVYFSTNPHFKTAEHALK